MHDPYIFIHAGDPIFRINSSDNRIPSPNLHPPGKDHFRQKVVIALFQVVLDIQDMLFIQLPLIAESE